MILISISFVVSLIYRSYFEAQEEEEIMIAVVVCKTFYEDVTFGYSIVVNEVHSPVNDQCETAMFCVSFFS